MKLTRERILLLLALTAVLVLAWSTPLDTAASHHVDRGLQRALVTFGTARLLNAVISVAQGVQVAVEPAGVGVAFAPGQVLRPINDLLAQFSELMLAASIVFGVMKILILIGSHWIVSLVLSAVAVGWVWSRGWKEGAPRWLAGILFLLLLVRFAVPLVTVGSDALFQVFMQDQYSVSQSAIAGSANEVSVLVPAAAEASDKSGMMGRITDWWSRKVDVTGRLEKLKEITGQLTEHIVKLIAVFLLQTLVIPLLLFWLLYRVCGMLLIRHGSGPIAR